MNPTSEIQGAQRVWYVNNTVPTSDHLNSGERFQVESLRQRFVATATMGLVREKPPAVSAAHVIVHPIERRKLSILAGEGYTPGGYRIRVDSPITSGVDLADYTEGTKNYVSLRYFEIWDTPISEVFEPYQSWETICHERYDVQVDTEATFTALSTEDRDSRLLMAIVTAHGASNLSDSDVENVDLGSNFPTPDDDTPIAGVTLRFMSSNTQLTSVGTPGSYGSLVLTVTGLGPATTKSLKWRAPNDPVYGSEVDVTGASADYTLTSGSGSYTATVRVSVSQLPGVSTTASVVVRNMYQSALVMHSAEDWAHRDMLGTGTATPWNPHALALADLEDAVEFLTSHQDLWHVNGISVDAEYGYLEPAIDETGDKIDIAQPTNDPIGNKFLVNGTAYGTLQIFDNVEWSAISGVTISGASADSPTGTGTLTLLTATVYVGAYEGDVMYKYLRWQAPADGLPGSQVEVGGKVLNGLSAGTVIAPAGRDPNGAEAYELSSGITAYKLNVSVVAASLPDAGASELVSLGSSTDFKDTDPTGYYLLFADALGILGRAMVIAERTPSTDLPGITLFDPDSAPDAAAIATFELVDVDVGTPGIAVVRLTKQQGGGEGLLQFKVTGGTFEAAVRIPTNTYGGTPQRVKLSDAAGNSITLSIRTDWASFAEIMRRDADPLTVPFETAEESSLNFQATYTNIDSDLIMPLCLVKWDKKNERLYNLVDLRRIGTADDMLFTQPLQAEIEAAREQSSSLAEQTVTDRSELHDNGISPRTPEGDPSALLMTVAGVPGEVAVTLPSEGTYFFVRGKRLARPAETSIVLPDLDMGIAEVSLLQLYVDEYGHLGAWIRAHEDDYPTTKVIKGLFVTDMSDDLGSGHTVLLSYTHDESTPFLTLSLDGSNGDMITVQPDVDQFHYKLYDRHKRYWIVVTRNTAYSLPNAGNTPGLSPGDVLTTTVTVNDPLHPKQFLELAKVCFDGIGGVLRLIDRRRFGTISRNQLGSDALTFQHHSFTGVKSVRDEIQAEAMSNGVVMGLTPYKLDATHVNTFGGVAIVNGKRLVISPASLEVDVETTSDYVYLLIDDAGVTTVVYYNPLFLGAALHLEQTHLAIARVYVGIPDGGGPDPEVLRVEDRRKPPSAKPNQRLASTRPVSSAVSVGSRGLIHAFDQSDTDKDRAGWWFNCHRTDDGHIWLDYEGKDGLFAVADATPAGDGIYAQPTITPATPIGGVTISGSASTAAWPSGTGSLKWIAAASTLQFAFPSAAGYGPTLAVAADALYQTVTNLSGAYSIKVNIDFSVLSALGNTEVLLTVTATTRDSVFRYYRVRAGVNPRDDAIELIGDGPGTSVGVESSYIPCVDGGGTPIKARWLNAIWPLQAATGPDAPDGSRANLSIDPAALDGAVIGVYTKFYHRVRPGNSYVTIGGSNREAIEISIRINNLPTDRDVWLLMSLRTAFNIWNEGEGGFVMMGIGETGDPGDPDYHASQVTYPQMGLGDVGEEYGWWRDSINSGTGQNHERSASYQTQVKRDSNTYASITAQAYLGADGGGTQMQITGDMWLTVIAIAGPLTGSSFNTPDGADLWVGEHIKQDAQIPDLP